MNEIAPLNRPERTAVITRIEQHRQGLALAMRELQPRALASSGIHFASTLLLRWLPVLLLGLALARLATRLLRRSSATELGHRHRARSWLAMAAQVIEAFRLARRIGLAVRASQAVLPLASASTGKTDPAELGRWENEGGGLQPLRA